MTLLFYNFFITKLNEELTSNFGGVVDGEGVLAVVLVYLELYVRLEGVRAALDSDAHVSLPRLAAVDRELGGFSPDEALLHSRPVDANVFGERVFLDGDLLGRKKFNIIVYLKLFFIILFHCICYMNIF